MLKQEQMIRRRGLSLMNSWRADWCKFAREALGVSLDAEQQAILRSVQFNARTSVASGTARGKDFVVVFVRLEACQEPLVEVRTNVVGVQTTRQYNTALFSPVVQA